MILRDYAKVSPKAWHGSTFKALRKQGPETLLVGLYLMTSPSSNMLGLYAQPLLYMAHELGLGLEGASKGLRGCMEAGFCDWDEDSEFVWVREMARYQVAESLKASDLRCKGIQRDYDSLPDNPFLGPFFDRYAAAFHMTNRRGDVVSDGSGEQAPSKAHRSQEQEQEQEQEKEKDLSAAGAASSTALPSTRRRPANSEGRMPTVQCPCPKLVELYHEKLPMLPRVKLMPAARQRAMRKAWAWVLTSVKQGGERRATNAEEALAWFGDYFARAAENDFLTGRGERSGPHATWRCDIDFLMTDRGMQHVIERTEVAA